MDVDWYIEDEPAADTAVDKEKAALNGISAGQSENPERWPQLWGTRRPPALSGEKEDVPIILRLPLSSLPRSQLLGIRRGLPRTAWSPSRSSSGGADDPEKSIYHKNLMPVIYVTADVAGARKARYTPSWK